ncbi:MAG: hypothetical protein IKC31_04295 [Clostridia bacterium]|nr:hypothetical protein [Clostridia bacterium]
MFNFAQFLSSLQYMWQGMLCIFIVILAIIAVVIALNAINAKAEEKKNGGSAQAKPATMVPARYAWLAVGVLSAISLIVQLVLIFKA